MFFVALFLQIASANPLEFGCTPHNTQFRDVRELSERLPRNPAIDATFKLSFGDHRCAASSVSSDGYVLTAAHCLQDCLQASGSAEQKTYQGSVGGTSYRFNATMRSPTVRGTCQVLVGEERMPMTAEIVDAGRCFLDSQQDLLQQARATIPQDSWPQLARQLEQICSPLEDYMVLKFERSPTSGQCAPVDPSPLRLAERVDVIGYPLATERGLQSSNSDGNPKYVSSGRVVQRDYCEVITDLPNASTRRVSLFRDHFYGMSMIDGLVQVTADAHGGNSGGPVPSPSGQVRGLLTTFIGPDGETEQCEGSSFVTPMSYIHARLQERRTDLGEIFNCPVP